MKVKGEKTPELPWPLCYLAQIWSLFLELFTPGSLVESDLSTAPGHQKPLLPEICSMVWAS